MSSEAPSPDPGSDDLADRLQRAFAGGVSEPWSDERFEGLALEVFRHQFAQNETYRRFCEGRGATPEHVTRWTDVPAVPARAFKHLDLVCGDPSEVEAVFRTSGTTSDGSRRGAHHVPRLALYRASLLPAFEAHVLPDVERIRFVSLIPSPEEVPDSSLSRMVGIAAHERASSVSWVVDGSGAIDRGALERALDAATTDGQPVLLLGTAFAFVHALDAGLPLGPLPRGSRIMETGGFKGRARTLPREELYGRLSKASGLPADQIVNEYGMTELLSQLYEPVLSGGTLGSGHLPPPWLRVRALDPTTLAPRGPSEEGILAFFDLANAGSVAHVLTEDVGRVEGGRVFLAGRTEGAEPRGCSRAMDELMGVAGAS